MYLRYPVLLGHGFGSVAGVIKPAPLNDVCMLFRSHGIAAFAPNIVPYNTIEIRAQAWAEAIRHVMDVTKAPKVNVMAHSMAGLDFRYAISSLDEAKHIASLTTISSPHRGSSLADLALSTPSRVREAIVNVSNWLGETIFPTSKSDVNGALEELTPSYTADIFNPANPDHPEIDYFSFSAACGKGTTTNINKVLIPFNTYLFDHEGPNDGFVSRQSSNWGTRLATTNLSHNEQIKLNTYGKRAVVWREFWIDVVKNLQNAGL